MKLPLVSVIVTTKNNTRTIRDCLDSIRLQTYEAIELIVVDNYSTDDTLSIAQEYTDKAWVAGPERSKQRDVGVEAARGVYICFIDSDMRLSQTVIAECVEYVGYNDNCEAVIIPEESIGEGFWAACKSLERSFYRGQDSVEAARFFSKRLFDSLGGYRDDLIAGEDWDLSRRAAAHTCIGRVEACILHDEGRLSLLRTISKKYYYSLQACNFFLTNPTQSALTDQSGPLARYKLFLSRPKKLFERPIIGIGMLFLKTVEYASGGFGYMKAKYFARKEEA
jgi:glycosyltransferase involved in cell wall biosynthesis